MDITIRPTRRISGRIAVPGDKSISHRALILSGIADGSGTVRNFPFSRDCLSTLECLVSLGVDIERVDEHTLEVSGVGMRGLQEPSGMLDAGNSGTTIRLLSGLLAAQPFFSVITGDGALRQRPMDRIVEPLRSMGARIHGKDEDRFAPLAIRGGPLRAIEYTMPVASAQVKSAILLAGLYAAGRTVVREPAPCRDHTERMLQHMGRAIEMSGHEVRVVGGEGLPAGELIVPGDISSAAYFLVAASVIPESELIVEGAGINPTRTGILKVLRGMGANISILDEREVCNEPVADLGVSSTGLAGIEISGKAIPTLIDELPVLAVAATQARGTTVVQDAAELRVKETDRIRAVAAELSKMGAKIEEHDDGWIIEGPTRLKGARCQSYGDHRIAMALVVAGLVAEGRSVVEGGECIDISYPGFMERVEGLVGC